MQLIYALYIPYSYGLTVILHNVFQWFYVCTKINDTNSSISCTMWVFFELFWISEHLWFSN